MKIILYKYTRERNYFPKSSQLDLVEELEGTLRSECSLTNPSIEIAATFINANYAYIQEFNRYYFIENVTSIRNGLWRVDMKVDVLESYSNEILTQQALVVRSADDRYFNEYLVDKVVSFYSDPQIIFKNYSRVVNFDKSVLFIITSRDKGISFLGGSGVTGTTRTGSSLSSTFLPWANKNITCYAIDNDDAARTIMSTIYRDYENYGSFILGMFLYPFAIDGFKQRTVQTFELADKSINLNNDIYICESAPSVFFDINLGDIFPQELLNRPRWQMFEPYAKFELFLPFVGLVNIPMTSLFEGGLPRSLNPANYPIHIKYNHDLTDGSATVWVYTDSEIIYRGECIFGIPIPNVSSNIETIQRQKNSNKLKFIGQLVSIFSSSMGNKMSIAGDAAGDALSGAPMKSIANLAGRSISNQITTAGSTIQATLNYKANDLLLVSSGQGGINADSVYLSYNDCLLVYAKLTYYKPTLTNYEHILGRPVNEVLTLNNLRGYTVISDCHLEDIFALPNELDEIYSLLQNGVIIGGS